MTPEAIQKAMREFIALVENPPVSKGLDENLALLLDRLALASHFGPIDGDLDALPPDGRAWTDVYPEIASAFPDYGLFDVAFPFSQAPGDTDLVTADAIDALADIYLALKQVDAIWEAAGAVSGLWEYRFSYGSHWHWHLRVLQLYLHARKLNT